MKRLVRRQVPVDRVGDLSPLLSRLYAGRGVTRVEEVDLRLSQLHPPDSMKGVRDAAAMLAADIRAGKRLLVIGDFDADGATSCTLLVHGLRAFGADSVNYLVPNRFDYGYGLTPEIVTVAERLAPDVIITVDNGISSLEGVEAAKKRGIAIIVTDHHLPGDRLPSADAIVNPNQPGCDFPSKNLAGVGVAFYLLSAVRQQLRVEGWFEAKGIEAPNLADYLDLVALGTIADVVPMDHNNRVLVQEGLRRIRAGRSRPGIEAMIQVSGRQSRHLVATDLAFQIAPRLNAAGRLEDISLGIECLLAADAGRALELAGVLDDLNRTRRDIENEMKDQAMLSLDADVWVSPPESVGLSLFHEDWHQGVIGILAGRIKDKYHRPVVVFAENDDGELRGSARSIAGLHIRDAFDSIAASHPGMLVRFGGHAMAAGLTLAREDLSRFAAAFDQEARRWLRPGQLEQVIVTDGELDETPSVPLFRSILAAAPWGQGFPEPVFDATFEILEQRIVGGRHLKLKLRYQQSGQVVDAIAFNHGNLVEGHYQRMAYRVDVNEYRGVETVQLIIEAPEVQQA